jgi:hypothetical protein
MQPCSLEYKSEIINSCERSLVSQYCEEQKKERMHRILQYLCYKKYWISPRRYSMRTNDKYRCKSLLALHIDCMYKQMKGETENSLVSVLCISNQGRTLQKSFRHESWLPWSLAHSFPECFHGSMNVETVRPAMATIDSSALVLYEPSLSFAL